MLNVTSKACVLVLNQGSFTLHLHPKCTVQWMIPKMQGTHKCKVGTHLIQFILVAPMQSTVREVDFNMVVSFPMFKVDVGIVFFLVQD